MTHYRLEANIAVELDVEAAFEWYELEETNLGVVFLEELRSTYQRILNNPLAFQELCSGIRRALTRKFPYAIYFVIESRSTSFSVWPSTLSVQAARDVGKRR